MAEQGTVLLIDDDAMVRTAICQCLQLENFEVLEYPHTRGVVDQLSLDWPGVIVSDINLPGESGLTLFEQVKQIDASIPVIFITGHGDISTAVSAIREGAYDFIAKPFANDDLLDVIRHAQEKRKLTLENRKLKQELQAQSAPGPRIIGNAASIHRLRQALINVADTSADILIQGETGTGKELVARYIHEHSGRQGKPFVAINCGAIPETIMESELFGHEKGAFTDAKTQRIGKLEHANGGTLFLDEIESMPASMQIRLLRVLEERRLERLGSNESVELDLRILAATKVDLKTLAETDAFREDLYYRLNVVRVDIPALRERTEDIPLLWQHFCLVATAQYKRESEPVSASRMHSLISYDWPGNVRELRNLAERYVLMGPSCIFEFDQIIPTNEHNPGVMTLAEQMERFEKILLEQELTQQKGSIKNTMNALGLPRKTLYDKMQKYSLDKDFYK